MIKKPFFIFLLICILVAHFVSLAADEATPTLDWSVIGAGGGTAQVSSFTLNSTIGQAVIGTSSVSSRSLCVGFWCNEMFYYLFLPLVLRGG
ncbi:MAG: hypothetical protein ACK44E_00435 [Anaerolineales bacterium]